MEVLKARAEEIIRKLEGFEAQKTDQIQDPPDNTISFPDFASEDLYKE